MGALTILDLQPVPVEVDHAGDEAPERALHDACEELRRALDPRELSPNARRLLDAIRDAVDGAEEG